jgi:hypothetical protein
VRKIGIANEVCRPTYLLERRANNRAKRHPTMACCQIAKERELQGVLPSKAHVRKTLFKVGRAAQSVIGLLNEATIMVFIEAESDIQINVALLESHLRAFANAVQLAAKSAAVTGAKGKTKRGRGKAMARIWLLPKDFCALVIAETWLFFRGRRPGPRNLEAGAAAHAFWLASGGTKSGWDSDPRKGWRDHFSDARSAQMRAMQAELRQKCLELSRESDATPRQSGE